MGLLRDFENRWILCSSTLETVFSLLEVRGSVLKPPCHQQVSRGKFYKFNYPSETTLTDQQNWERELEIIQMCFARLGSTLATYNNSHVPGIWNWIGALVTLYQSVFCPRYSGLGPQISSAIIKSDAGLV